MADPAPKSDPTEEEVEEVEGSEEEIEEISGELPSQLMQNPQVLAALQSRLGSMVGTPSGYIQSLPKEVKRRIKALKKLQFEAVKIEAQFYEEVHQLECKYSNRYVPLVEKRRDIVNGVVEPTDEESDWPSDKEDEAEDLSEEMKNKASIEESTEKKEEEPVKGIPHFWHTVFKNVDMLSEMVQECDEPILQHLLDIKVKFTDKDPMGFTLEFYFEHNDYFTNTVLTKEYFMRSFPDESEPLSFEGPEITKCKGENRISRCWLEEIVICKIDWNKGKNVTVKVVKKKQKHKGRGTTRTVTKSVQNDSFFNFFNPPTVNEDDETEMDEETEALLAADFEIGHFIRERIVPRAVLYFTGEALDEDEDNFDEEEGEEGEEGDYDEEHDPDYNPQGDGKQPAECKQQ